MFDRSVIGGVHVLTPRKNLVGGDETRELTVAVARLAGEATPRIVLDLQRIHWVSSLGIEALRRIHRTCAAGNGWLRLVNVGARINSVLLTMRLHWVFETFDSMDEAVGPVGLPAAPGRAADPAIPTARS